MNDLRLPPLVSVNDRLRQWAFDLGVHQLEDVKDGCKAKETTEKKSKDQFRHPIYIIIFVFSVHDEDK
jgi:hypothetical protein